MLRGSLLAGDAARFERGRKSYPYVSVQWAFLAEPFAADIVGRLPPTDLPEALDHCLEASINRSLPVDPIIDACARGSSPARHIGWIGYARALQGRFDDAERLFEDLPLNDRRTKTAKFAVAVTRGLTAMLRGDDDRALLHIEEALAIESGNRKRFVFPKSRAFHLSLLALVRADLPEIPGTARENSCCQNLAGRTDTGTRTRRTRHGGEGEERHLLWPLYPGRNARCFVRRFGARLARRCHQRRRRTPQGAEGLSRSGGGQRVRLGSGGVRRGAAAGRRGSVSGSQRPSRCTFDARYVDACHACRAAAGSATRTANARATHRQGG